MTDAGLENETFYEVVATLIPLVAVVLLIEYSGGPQEWRSLTETLHFPGDTMFAPLVALVLTVALALAEAAALDILYRAPEEASVVNRTLIMLGLLVGALGIWVPLSIHALLHFDEALKERPCDLPCRSAEILGRTWEWPSVAIAGVLIALLVAALIWFVPHFWPM